MARIAALVLSYNDAATIGAAVSSIVSQGHGRLTELVLADDASTDNSVDLARAAAGSLPFNVLRRETNAGERRNLNRSLAHLTSAADWVVLLHADDVVMDGWLDAIVERICRCPPNVASICCSWDMMLDGRITETGEASGDVVRTIAGTDRAVHDTLLNGCWWKLSGAALNLRAFEAVGEFDPDMPQCGDWDWLLRALSRGWSFEYLPRSYIQYRQHARSVSSKSLRADVDIAEAMILVERFGSVLNKLELVRFHARRGYYVLRRMGRGVLGRDVKRVGTSLRTWRMLTRHLAKQLAN